MTHVFISYSHSNKDELEKLVTKLHDNGFTDEEIWYDKDISGGQEWRDEIELKLKEAFVVVVIVTQPAMKSTYVTYEWSWALGNGTPVVPLLFEDMSFSEIHARLRMINHISCYDKIPDSMIEDLKNYQKTPADTLHLNFLVFREILDVRILARIALWLYPYSQCDIVNRNLCDSLMGQTAEEAKQAHLDLTEMMVDKSHAFTSKQKRWCRELIENLRMFWEMFHDKDPLRGTATYSLKLEFNSMQIEKMEQFRANDLEPLFCVFQKNDTLGVVIYKELDSYLGTISQGNITPYSPSYKGNLPATGSMMKPVFQAIENVRKHVNQSAKG